jgi:hypothetical protein
MPMVNPYVAQLMIELLDIIRIRAPFDTAHVIRAADRADIPITNTGVMRLLRRPLDQRTTTALTAELARYGEVYLDMVERSRVELRWIPTGDGRHWIVPDPPRTDQDPYWEDHLDPHMSDNTQTRLRHHIKTAVTR